MAWDNATKMEIRNVLPDYTTEDEDEWNGWEAREISIYCKEAAQFHNYGEYYITLIFQSDTPNQCGNTFLFVSCEQQWDGYRLMFSLPRLPSLSHTLRSTAIGLIRSSPPMSIQACLPTLRPPTRQL